MLAVHELLQGHGLTVRDVHCSAPRGAASGEEYCTGHEIVLPRRGVFVRLLGRQRLVADSNHALVFRRGENHRVSHPIHGGDACTVFSITDERLREIVAEIDEPAANEEQLEIPARVASSPLVDWLHREILRSLRHDQGGSGVGEVVLELIAQLLQANRQDSAGPPRRAETRHSHADLVERTQWELARTIHEKLDLAELSRTVSSSPFHLSRLFRRYTGLTIHRYHERLRLRHGLQCILDGWRDLTELAADLGFAHHSHFTNRFRSEFGRPPSSFRSRRDLADLRAAARQWRDGPTAPASGSGTGADAHRRGADV